MKGLPFSLRKKGAAYAQTLVYMGQLEAVNADGSQQENDYRKRRTLGGQLRVATKRRIGRTGPSL